MDGRRNESRTLAEVASRALTSILMGGPAGASSSVRTDTVSLGVLKPTLFLARTLIKYLRAGSKLRMTAVSELELSLAVMLSKSKCSPFDEEESSSGEDMRDCSKR